MNTNQPKTRNLLAERRVQKHHHDRKIFSKATTETFKAGQRVAIQDPVSKQWSIKGQIVEEVAPRSFTIRTSGTQQLLRRNRRHIRKLHSTTSSTINLPTNEQHQQYEHYNNNDQEVPTPTQQELFNELPDEQFDNSADESDSDTIPYSDRNTYEAIHEGQYITKGGRAVQTRKPLDYEEI